MKNLKKFEELNYDTYISAASKLKSGHSDRSTELVKHAQYMKNKNFDYDYIVYPNTPSILKNIVAKKTTYGTTIFTATFTDVSKDKDSYYNRNSFEFQYFEKFDGKLSSSPEKLIFKNYYDGEDSEGKIDLFTNRKDALKFKKEFSNWLIENDFEQVVPALNKLPINELYTENKLDYTRHLGNNYDGEE